MAIDLFLSFFLFFKYLHYNFVQVPCIQKQSFSTITCATLSVAVHRSLKTIRNTSFLLFDFLRIRKCEKLFKIYFLKLLDTSTSHSVSMLNEDGWSIEQSIVLRLVIVSKISRQQIISQYFSIHRPYLERSQHLQFMQVLLKWQMDNSI